MSLGGRKYQGEPGPAAPLAEFFIFIQEAMRNAGFQSINQLEKKIGSLVPKNRLYDICQGRELARQDEAKHLARALSIASERMLSVLNEARTATERKKLTDAAAQLARKSDWADPPLPSGTIEDLLEAEHELSELFPYHLLGLRPPPASTVFIKPSLDAVGAASIHGRAQPPIAMAGVELKTAINKHEHVLIVGDPGSGKSMLARSIVRNLSSQWLRIESRPITDEALVPIYLPANHIPEIGPWSNRVAEAVSRNEYLLAAPTSDIFSNRIYGARWLMVVDGLDEIADREKRRELLHVLRSRLSRLGPHRMLLTTRHLPAEDLDLLRTPNTGEYVLEPFDEDRLNKFAIAWYETQEASEPVALAGQFTAQVLRSDLREIVSNPLLATIAISTANIVQNGDGPNNQIELYETFIRELLSARPEFNKQPQVGTSDWQRWLYSARRALLEALARVHLDGETCLLEFANNWAVQNRPSAALVDHNSHLAVERVLAESGLVRVTGGRVQFIHQSIAEYLAAGFYAADINRDPEGLDPWIEKAAHYGSSRNLALLALAIWTQSPGNDAGQLFRRIFRNGYEALRTATQVVAAGAAVDLDVGTEISNRIIRLFIDRSYSSEALDVIRRARSLPTLAERLASLVSSNTLSYSRRVDAAGAYGIVGSNSRAVQMLTEILDAAPAHNKVEAIYELASLGYQKSLLVETAQAILDDTTLGYWPRFKAAEALERFGAGIGIVELCCEIVERPDQSDSYLVEAAKLLLRAGGPSYATKVTRLMERPGFRLWEIDSLIEELADQGCEQQVIELASIVFQHPDAESSEETVPAAIQAWARFAVQNGDGAELAASVAQLKGGYEYYRALQELYEAGLVGEAEALIKEYIVSYQLHDFAAQRVASTLLEIGVDRHAEFVITNVSPVVLVQLKQLVNYMLGSEAGRHQLVAIARPLIQDPGVPHQVRIAAIDAWLAADVTQENTVLGAVRSMSTSAPELLAFATSAYNNGALAMAQSLSREVLRDRMADRDNFLAAAKINVRGASDSDSSDAIAILRANPRFTMSDRAWVAAQLQVLGRRVSDLWIDVLVGPDGAIELRTRAAEELRRVDALDMAISALDAALVRPHSHNEEHQLNRLKCWMKDHKC